MANPNTSISDSFGGAQSHRPRTPDITSHGPHSTAAIPRSAPPALARKAAQAFPRTRWAHEVVIPQEGQRTPNHCTNVQGGSPSC
jgi:hypothetical protein